MFTTHRRRGRSLPGRRGGDTAGVASASGRFDARLRPSKKAGSLRHAGGGGSRASVRPCSPKPLSTGWRGGLPVAASTASRVTITRSAARAASAFICTYSILVISSLVNSAAACARPCLNSAIWPDVALKKRIIPSTSLPLYAAKKRSARSRRMLRPATPAVRQSEADWSLPYSAAGAERTNDRFSIFLRCASYFQRHVGQMIYLAREVARCTS